MNRAFLIIGVPFVGVAAFYAAALWGRSMAAIVAIGLTLILGAGAAIDQRRRAGQTASPGQGGKPVAR